jgi:FAD/FMN-containing dehydrogenase
LQTVVGCKSEADVVKIKELAHSRLQALSTEVAGNRATGEYHAGFLHEWNDPRLVYGENFERLKEIKMRHDPADRFNKGVDLLKC